jgi:acetyl esterase/lipase
MGQAVVVERDDEIRLYDGPAPGSEDWTHASRRYWSELWGTEVVGNVVVPTITPVPASASPTGVGAIVAPGGGFHALSIDSEGFAVADRLAAAGIVSFVLQYRTVPGSDDPIADVVQKVMAGGSRLYDDMATVAPLAGADGVAAMRLVRARAEEFAVDPDRLGFVGFSAGGNVAMRVAYTDDEGARPSWLAPIYVTTRGLDLGEPPPGSGPMFLTVATDDELGLTDDSIDLYERWRRAKLPVELHAYAEGGHGFGMRTNHVPSDTWIDRFLDWCAATIPR